MNDYKEMCERPELCWGYIDELRAAISQIVRERDAAIADLKNAARFPCRYCAKNNDKCDCYTAHDKWEWRGAQDE